MKICPICGKKYNEPSALSRKDNETQICPDCGTKEALDDFDKHRMLPAERTRAKVYSTGNKWAIENFENTHN